MADRPEMFGPNRGLSGMADSMEPWKMLWGRSLLIATATKFRLGAEIQSPTGLSRYFIRTNKYGCTINPEGVCATVVRAGLVCHAHNSTPNTLAVAPAALSAAARTAYGN